VSFILRILFSGLIAFIPSADGHEVTVLLLNVGHDHHLSDSSTLTEHMPLLLARAGDCTGDCPKRDEDIAQFLFADQTLSTAQDSLETALAGGGGWKLAASDLSLNKGSFSDPELPSLVLRDNVRGTVNGQPELIPTTSTERQDFTWIANLSDVCDGCTLDSSVLGSDPPEGLVAARFHLRSGNVFTYSVARIGSDVTPVHFKRLDNTGSESPYTQAVATWVAADIEVSGDSVEIAEESFGGSPGRTMTLTPDENDKVEVALLNLPPFVTPSTTSTATPLVGKHFETYYDLTEEPPDAETRLVPMPGAATGADSYPEVDWHDIHPSNAVWSDLLNGLRMEIGRSLYDQVLCPPVRNDHP
jgi:hypothetical protein